MTVDQLKAAAAERLHNLGIEIPDSATFTILSDAIGTLGGKRPYNAGREDHVRAWMAPQRTETSVRVFRAIDPAKVKPHDRQVDIDAGQPPFMTPRGAIGNGSENSPVWRR